MLKKGKLYRVNDYALGDRNVQTSVKDHGWLWLWTGDTRPMRMVNGKLGTYYVCKAVTTGSTMLFFKEELEAADAGEG